MSATLQTFCPGAQGKREDSAAKTVEARAEGAILQSSTPMQPEDPLLPGIDGPRSPAQGPEREATSTAGQLYRNTT